MTERNFTKEERVLRALRACGTGTWQECQKCPYQGLDSKLDKCWEKLCADAVAILELQARCIGILDAALDESALVLGKMTDEARRARSEAVHSFLEYLKQNYSEIYVFVRKLGEEEVQEFGYAPALLDELAKEFLGRGDVHKDGEPWGKDYFSAEEVRCMSLEEVAVHREIIIRSMRMWHGEGAEGGAK